MNKEVYSDLAYRNVCNKIIELETKLDIAIEKFELLKNHGDGIYMDVAGIAKEALEKLK